MVWWQYVPLLLVFIICLCVVANAVVRWVDQYRETKWRLNAVEGKVTHWQTRYCIPENEFYYKWSRVAGEDDDLEIIQWCIEKNTDKVKFKYHNESGPSRSGYPACVIEVWITDPRLAMEFKLRYHGV